MTFDSNDTSDWTVDDHIEWMRHHAESLRIMNRLKLNAIVTTMVYYDLPWMRDFQTSHDALDVQQALLEHGPNPVLVRKAEEGESKP